MIYVNDASRIAYLDVPVTPVSGSLDVLIYNEGELVYDVPTVVAVDGLLTFTMPFFLCQSDKVLDINWKFNYSENSTTYPYDGWTKEEIVTPILSRREILEIHPQATSDEIDRIERAVRTIIQAHTGQVFGKFEGTFNVKGNGTRSLNLPARLLELEKVNDTEPGDYFLIGAEGWTLNHFPWGVPPIKADYYELHQHRGGVIHNPNNVRLGEWLKSASFNIRGTWGWYEVPEPVKEAARLLINDYACADQNYRDRYLTSMTAADWRIQYNSGAYLKTGNVRADQLLNDYVLKRGWAVI